MTGIFLIGDDGDLAELQHTKYESEDLLQGLLEKYPNLIPGDQVDASVPRRWLLVTREAGVPDQEGGGDRWSLDHLFLDQDAMPTLVEVKRSSDTRIRREVVGQMLDYAANAVVFWPVEKLRTFFESRCASIGQDPDGVLEEFLKGASEVEEFWQRVKTNLQAGKIRLLFVADEIPRELRRIVEFLNEQMDPAQVLALEVKQYEGSGMKSLIPRLIGQTEQAQQRKSAGGERRQWDEASFFEVLKERGREGEEEVARRLLAWSNEKMTRMWWGQGKITGSFVPVLDFPGGEYYPINVWTGYTHAQVEMGFEHMKAAPFNTPDGKRELINKLNEIPAINISPDAVGKRPNIRLIDLLPANGLDAFIGVLNWSVERVKEANP